MKTSERIFTKLQELLHSESFKLKHRLSEKAFVRKTVLNFVFLVSIILNQLKKSNSAEINFICTSLNRKHTFTKSALSKARRKLSPNAFIELNEVLTEEFYKIKSNLKRFFGFTVWAIDGSKFQLPEGDEIKSKYGCSSNHTGDNMNMALVSQLVDVINGVVLHAILSPFKASEQDLAIKHINAFVLKRSKIPNLAKSIILFDRGYPSTLLIAKLFHNNIQFLMRAKNPFFKEITVLMNSGKKDGIIKINLRKLSKSDKIELSKECPGIDLNAEMSIRVVIVILNSGEKEILLTSLLDAKKYSYKKFKKFYFLRWGIETIYGFEKIRAQIENFSGKTTIAIEQDFYASILHINMTMILSIEAKKELDEEGVIKNRKYKYEINFSIALAYMKNRFIKALLDSYTKPKKFCSEIKALMKNNLEPIRPEREFKHERKHKKKRYPTNTRAVQ